MMGEYTGHWILNPMLFSYIYRTIIYSSSSLTYPVNDSSKTEVNASEVRQALMNWQKLTFIS